MRVVRELVSVAVRVGAVRSRDAAWFEALYRSCYSEVLQYARRRVSSAEADDVVAEAFAAAWRRREEVAEIDRAWLLRAASNYLLHAYRSAGRRARLHQKLAQLDPAAGASIGGDAGGDPDLESAMRGLSGTDQELLRLSAWEQLEPRELAVVFGCSTATARVRLHRARRRLAALLAVQPHAIDSRSEAN